jgi:acetyl CoA:N6-hydroxylysine acetyl transferase
MNLKAEPSVNQPNRKCAPSSVHFQWTDPTIGREISFRLVTLEEDLDRLHRWQAEPYVSPFWNLAIPYEAYREHLIRFLADRHHTLYIGELDGQPMSYWESYWVLDDIVGRTYDYHPEDQGIHLLIGEPEYIGRGVALPLLRAMTALQFQHEPTQKVIAEPDIGNKKMIHVFEKCGFTFQKEIDLPDKRAALLFCHREEFMRRWRHVF